MESLLREREYRDLMSFTNHLGQPIGFPLPDWTAPPRPPSEVMEGRLCRLEPLNVKCHSESLFSENAKDEDGSSWTYLAYGPFPTVERYRDHITTLCDRDDYSFYAIIDKTDGAAIGVASYLNIEPHIGVIEVGSIHFSPRLQRTTSATESMFLMMKRAFELGYRRYTWKCDSLNATSRAAAQRLGLSFEGLFRQARVYNGRTRDTAWYAAIDSEWPGLREAFVRWLDPDNFDKRGVQITRLSDFTGPILKSRG